MTTAPALASCPTDLASVTRCPLSPSPDAAGRARSFTRNALTAWGLDDLVDDAELVVTELLANAVRHSGARMVYLRIEHTAGMLRVEVADDGHGGADPARGSGLRGVERRLATFDGILAVSSPPGGPTMIAMEVPCVLSSPKTCSC
jgi:hypothetical protein